MLTNPLIIATVAGLLVKASGLTVPQTAIAWGVVTLAGLDPVEAGVSLSDPG